MPHCLTCRCDEPQEAETAAAQAAFGRFWTAYPGRGSPLRKIGKANTRILFMRLSADEQLQCAHAAIAYARYCRDAERTPRDPQRFLRSRDNWAGMWRDFARDNEEPVSAFVAPRAAALMTAAKPSLTLPLPIGEPCHPEVAAKLRAIIEGRRMP